ncbi:hypothetical protein BD310DRAFT_953648 [Dichomitus squalens]|uniref:CSN8/PSMD8/EIF3K domain-containing protein n=1 Tax=Dichomitus squalens TaxID=114155 RepID=A0A4V2K9X0_9APHY|nr:hypothetical protein BD310DRAFT_953648 [Dichomitus squalens]
MTGPPTPPPSSATEIQDAARTTMIPPQAAAAAPDPVAPVAQPAIEPVQAPADVVATNKTSYELLFPSIVTLARNGDLRDLIGLAEHGDLTGGDDADHTRLFLVVPLVLAYMIRDELTPARYALIRLPNALSSLPITQSLFGLLASVSERKFSQIYTRAEALRNIVSEPGFPNPELGQVLAGMIDAFVGKYPTLIVNSTVAEPSCVESFRKKTFALLARAYTSLSLPLAQTYLGYTAEQVVNVAVLAGWDFHETTYTLTPPKQATSSARLAVDSVPSSLMALNLVVESVANLEA